jgi:hypothetical protein
MPTASAPSGRRYLLREGDSLTPIRFTKKLDTDTPQQNEPSEPLLFELALSYPNTED